MTIATSTTVGIMIVMESAIIGVATKIATNGAIMVTATMMTTVVLKQPSVTRNISKAHKPAVRNGVVLSPALVKPILDRKVRRFGANNLMASRTVARAAREASPAMAPKARKPVDRARRTAVPKVDLSRIAVTELPAAKPVQTE